MDQSRRITVSVVMIGLIAVSLVGLGLSGIQRGEQLEGFSLISRQILWIILGSGVAAFGWTIPYQRLRSWGYPLLAVSLLLLCLVFLFPPINGARRWIPLGPISLQPSELAKIAVILSLGHFLMYRKNHRTLLGLIPPFLIAAVPVILILKEPDLGTAMLFFPVMYAMLFTAGARRSHLLISLIAGMLFVPVLWQVMTVEQKSRVTSLFLQNDQGVPDSGDGFHLYQSKLLLSLGGIWGSELQGEQLDDPAAYRLPAGQTDFVFCLIGERWGLLGTIGVLALFSGLAACGLHVSATTRDPFGRLLATGIVMLFATQVLINTSMTIGLSPITGITLPLVSYGGTSFLTSAFCIGLLMNLASSTGFDLAGQPFDFSSTANES